MKRFFRSPSRKTLFIEIAVGLIIIFSAYLFLSIPFENSKTLAKIASTEINIKTIQKQAEIYYLNDNSYGREVGDCFGGMFLDEKIQMIFSEISKNIAGRKSILCETSIDGSRYAIEIDRPIEREKICFDSTGFNDVSKGTFDGVCTR